MYLKIVSFILPIYVLTIFLKFHVLDLMIHHIIFNSQLTCYLAQLNWQLSSLTVTSQFTHQYFVIIDIYEAFFRN